MGKRLYALCTGLLAASAMLQTPANAQTASTATPYEIPFTEIWNTWKSDLQNNVWTVEDKNNDGIVWGADTGLGNFMVYDGTSQKQAADDWVVSPPLQLTAGMTYQIATSAFYYGNGLQLISAGYGTGDDPSEYTTVIPETTVNAALSWTGSLQPTVLNGTFTPSVSGNYRIGFHCTSKERGYLILNGVKVTEASAEGVRPAKVADLVVEVGAKGAVSSKVKFTVPTKDVNGSALTSVSKVQIYRDNTSDAIKTYTSPAPGEAIEWQDETVTTGEHPYSVVVTANEYRSEEAKATVYVGVDTPKAPTNFKGYDNLDGTVTFTWDPITEKDGAHGGYVDTSELYYSVYNLYYGYLQEVTGGTGLTKNSLTVSGISYEGAQSLLQYVVYAQTNTPADTLATSDYARVETFVVGGAYSLPYEESFSNGSLTKGPWAIASSYAGRFGLSTSSADGDNGSIYFVPSNVATSARLDGPKVDVSNAANPTLSFAYYAYPGSDGRINVYVKRNGQTLLPVGSVDYSSLDGNEGWRTASFDLTEFSTAGITNGYLCPYFEAVSEETTVTIDQVRIFDAVNNNLEASLDAPARAQAGKSASIVVKVRNLGLSAANNYKVHAYVNNKLVETQEETEGLASGDSKEYEFAYTPALNEKSFVTYGEVEWDDDQLMDNNVTSEAVVEVTFSSLPSVDDLAASMNGSDAVLTWSEKNTENAEVTETFENYDPFASAKVGDWTLYDGDKAGTYTFGGISFQGMGNAMSYVVFNPYATTGLSGSNLEQFASIFGAHSGKQYMGSCSATIDTGTPTSDWLITPELSGEEQTVTFYAFSPSDEVNAGVSSPSGGPETFDVYYSEDDTNVNSFIKLKENLEATCDWTKFSVDVPEGAKYVAVVHTTTGSTTSYGYEPFWFGVDDFTYRTAALKIIGYNVYRDGKLLKKLDSKTTSYTDANVGDGYHTYNVIVSYATGDSGLSNTASVGTVGIDTADNGLVGVAAGKGCIKVNGANGAAVKVCTAAGATAFHGNVKGNATIALKSGLYLVKVGNTTSKVVVK